MKLKSIFILILAFPAFVFAQEMPKEPHFIEVTGTVEQEIEPNEIYMTIRLREFEENRQKIALETIDANFLSAVKDAGIDRKQLELSDAGSQLIRIRRKEKGTFREKTYQVKLSSAAQLEKLMEKLESVKVESADIMRVHHSELEKMKMDLKVKALQVAKVKAETLLKSIGAEIGKPILVREIDSIPYARENYYSNSAIAYDRASGEESSVGFKKIKLQAQVLVQFEIK